MLAEILAQKDLDPVDYPKGHRIWFPPLAPTERVAVDPVGNQIGNVIDRSSGFENVIEVMQVVSP